MMTMDNNSDMQKSKHNKNKRRHEVKRKKKRAFKKTDGRITGKIKRRKFNSALERD